MNDYNSLSQDEQLNLIRSSGSFFIQYIDNPSLEVQLAAVQLHGYSIQYIKNPPLEVQLVAVQQNGNAIKYIGNPSEEVQLAAVKQNGSAIRSIKKPTLETQLAVVQNDVYKIIYIANPSPKLFIDSKSAIIKFILVKIKINSMIPAIAMIEYLDDHNVNWPEIDAIKQSLKADKLLESNDISEETKLKLVKNNGKSIEYFDDPSEQLQLEAINQNPLYIRYIKNPTENVQMAAVERDGHVLEYILNPTEKVQILAIGLDSNLIHYVKNPSVKCQTIAISNMPEILTFPDFFIKKINNQAIEESKSSIIKYILTKISNNNIHKTKLMLNTLKKHLINWPELNIIKNSLKADKRIR